MDHEKKNLFDNIVTIIISKWCCHMLKYKINFSSMIYIINLETGFLCSDNLEYYFLSCYLKSWSNKENSTFENLMMS